MREGDPSCRSAAVPSRRSSSTSPVPLSLSPLSSHSYEPGPGFEPVALPAWAPATPTTPVWLIQLPPDVSRRRKMGGREKREQERAHQALTEPPSLLLITHPHARTPFLHAHTHSGTRRRPSPCSRLPPPGAARARRSAGARRRTVRGEGRWRRAPAPCPPLPLPLSSLSLHPALSLLSLSLPPPPSRPHLRPVL